MIQIHAFQNDLEKIVEIINKAFSIDVAIFDLQSRLVACTKDYLLQKGNIVHAPSIEEVIANGNVVVNKPGHMPTCQGCRFLGNCPAKIEILRSIRTSDTPLGVITFTSFSQAGHEKIIRKINEFIDTLNTFAVWIAQFLSQRQIIESEDWTHHILEASMGLTRENILVFNPDGSVKNCSASAGELFSFCDLYTRSIYHILPEPVADKIMQGNYLKDTRLKIDNLPVLISAQPVFSDDVLKAAVVLIKKFHDPATTGATSRLTAKSKNRAGSTISPDNLLGESQGIQRLKRQVQKLVNSNSTVLITGETGTGKGLLARVVHFSSSRAQGPFVPVNCTSIPETLFESELFGYEEGAFTGAKKGGKPGRFELAQGGTLFLDEIGEMPLHMQVKLLNVLQDYAFQRVGGINPISMDVRIIAATNQDLDQLVTEKKFRSDLYYRLNVIPMLLPPLCERKKDIPDLAATFLKESNNKAGRDISHISEPVMHLFDLYDWPGNIRELQNIIEYSVNMETSDIISVQSLPDWFRKRIPQPKQKGAFTLSGFQEGKDIKSKVMMTERDTILSCLDRNGHDVKGKKKTAQELGISLRTLYRKLGACGKNF